MVELLHRTGFRYMRNYTAYILHPLSPFYHIRHPCRCHNLQYWGPSESISYTASMSWSSVRNCHISSVRPAKRESTTSSTSHSGSSMIIGGRGDWTWLGRGSVAVAAGSR